MNSIFKEPMAVFGEEIYLPEEEMDSEAAYS